MNIYPKIKIFRPFKKVKKDRIYYGGKPIPLTKINHIGQAVCQILLSLNKSGSGFLVNIPLSDSENIQGLITNNHVLNEENLENGKKIEFKISNVTNSDQISFFLNSSRFRFTDKDLDVTFIEVFSEDFNLHLVKPVFLDVCEKVEFHSLHYILQYPEGQSLSYNPGTVLELKNS
jgi:hypothetical protein